MLENTNDYMSIFTVLFILALIVWAGFHLISLRTTARHLRQEADYYSFKKEKNKVKKV